jgi:hypothetical protein
MEQNEASAPVNSAGQPRVMDKSAYELIHFILYTKAHEEQRSIIMYRETQNPVVCEKCGEVHIVLNEFYYHYN